MPEVWSKGLEEVFVDETAEEQVVLRELVGDEACEFEDVEHVVAGRHLKQARVGCEVI